VTKPLRILVFDATQLAKKPPGLGLSWRAGSVLYRALGRIDASFPARDWTNAFDWLARVAPDRPIGEVQYWGHGKWGRALIDRDVLDRRALNPTHHLHAGLQALRARLTNDALIWFRTCETLGANAGHDFTSALADFTGARVAGHTYEIAFFQSGLHVLAPGMRPHWSADEGIARGTAHAPERSRSSHPDEPNTITCFTGAIPKDCT
jgi:hypothetical protein